MTGWGLSGRQGKAVMVAVVTADLSDCAGALSGFAVDAFGFAVQANGFVVDLTGFAAAV